MLRHFLTRQFGAFLVVGGTAAVLNWLARLVFSQWFGFAVAVLLAYGVGMAVAFSLNRRYVFPASARPIQAQARDFVLVNLATLPLVWGAAVVLDQLLVAAGMRAGHEALAHGIAVALPALASFLAHKFYTFRSHGHERR